MMLADLGADVVRVDRAGSVRDDPPPEPPTDVLGRGRKSIGVDLKSAEGVELVLSMVAQADVLMEGFRPGVTERMGLGPDECLARNPKLVYGRMTGWGQSGPYAPTAGHDINYIALSGVLDMIGRHDSGPVPPLNLVGDFGGGGMFLAYGIVAALLSAERTGQGQVVDAAMVDGAAVLANFVWGLKASGIWGPDRGTNMLDTGAHFYDVYETADNRWVSIGSIEPQFYALLRQFTGTADDPAFDSQMSPQGWPDLKDKLRAIFATKTRDEWDALLEGTDTCYAPVLSPEEATQHAHNVERETFIDVGGMTQAAPAPRFSVTANDAPQPAAHPGQHTDELLERFGIGGDQAAALKASGAVR